ncbi:MAG: autotransporter domain-containing protein [Candidatus Omnitrophica bacterium]|nr:autotransporter domain-containing protein [Candidatus Omnitrophota bacterium]
MRKILAVSTVVIYAFSFFSTAFAADKTWNGGGLNNNWNTGDNWGGAAPIANDALFFDGATRLTPNNDIVADTNFGGITFNAGASTFTLEGNRITLGGNVANDSISLQTIDIPMIMGATRTFTANTGSIALSQTLSGAGGLTKDGTGTLTLTGVNTYAGLTTVNAGELDLNAAGGALADDLTVAGGTAKLLASAQIADDAFLVVNSGTFNIQSFDDKVMSLEQTGGTISGTSGTLTSSSDFNMQAGTVSAILGGASGLAKTTAGTTILSGANTYTAATTVNAGVLNIRNDSATGTTAWGTTVADGAALETQGGIAVGGEALTLNGTGIEGAGALRNISGDNDWGGQITLGSATRINSDSGTLTLSGVSIFLDGFALTVGGSGNTTIAGSSSIAPSASTITKDGSGTFTIGSSNSYTGLTTVSAGVLNIRRATATGTTAGGVTVTDGAALETQGDITVGAEALTLNGTGIEGAGALRNISGNNSWAGDITLGSATRINSDDGTLTLSGATGGAFGLTVGGGGNTTISGIIGTGANTLTKDGAGTLTLTGANTYTGTTTVSEGELDLNAAAGAIDGNLTVAGGTAKLLASDQIANGSSVAVSSGTFNIQSFDETVIILQQTGGTISGTSGTLISQGDYDMQAGDVSAILGGASGLTKTTAGTTNLSGANTYTGTTTVNAGVLNIQNASATGDALTFSGTGTVNVTDGLSPSMAVTTSANNQGTLTYLGTSTSGGTIGAAGFGLAALNLNGGTFTLGHDVVATTTTANNAATVAVNADRTITGNFTLADTSTLSIGTSTLTLDGASGVYTQGDNTTLMLGVAGTSSGQVVGSGNAVVNTGSTVNVSVTSDFIPDGTTYTVVDGAGGGGVNVPSITDNSTFVTFTGTSLLGDLILVANRTNSFAAIASTLGDSDASAAATALEAAGADPNATADMLNILNTLEASPASEIGASVATYYPSVDNGTIQASYSALNQSINTVERRLSVVRLAKNTARTGISTGDETKKGIEIWGEGFGNYLHQYSSNGIDGYKAALWGVTAGADREIISHNSKVGLSGGYVNGYVNSKNKNNRTIIHSSQVTTYGTYDWNSLYFDAAFSFALNKYLGKRNIRIANAWRTANSDYYGQQYSGYLGMGYTFNKGKGLEITPIGSMQYMHLHLNAYKETEAGALNLNIGSQDYDLVQSGVGVKVNYPLKLSRYEVTPEFRWVWLHDFVGKMQQSIGNTYEGGGTAFDTYGVRPDRNTHDLGASLSLDTDLGVSITASYDCQLRRDLVGHSGVVTVKYDF